MKIKVMNKQQTNCGFAGLAILLITSVLAMSAGGVFLLSKSNSLEEKTGSLIQNPDSLTTPTTTIRNKRTGEIKQVDEQDLPNYRLAQTTPSPVPKEPSTRAMKNALLTYTLVGEENQKLIIKQWSRGTNSSSIAIKNLAIYYDSDQKNLDNVEALLRKFASQGQKSKTTATQSVDSPDITQYEPYVYPTLKPTRYSLYQQYESTTQIPSYTTPKPYVYVTPAPINVYGGASTYTKIGNTTYGSDGSTYQQIGNTLYGNDNSTYSKIGNTVYGNDNSTYSTIGNTTYGSDGSTVQQIGNTYYGNDGSSYTQIGNTFYGSQ